MKTDTIGDNEAATLHCLIEQAEANMREGRIALGWCDECALYVTKIDVQTSKHEVAHVHPLSWELADCTGMFD
jgi:hypothetical protein